MSSYKIERKFFQTDKPYWILQVLLALRPTAFEKTDSKTCAQENLKSIGEILRQQRCYHYGKNRLLLEIRNIVQSEDSITVTSFGNKKYMSFNIVELH